MICILWIMIYFAFAKFSAFIYLILELDKGDAWNRSKIKEQKKREVVILSFGLFFYFFMSRRFKEAAGGLLENRIVSDFYENLRDL